MNDLTTPMSYPPQQPRQSPISQPIPIPVSQPYWTPPPERRTKLVLLIACAIAFAAAAVFGGLYVGADGDHDAAVALLTERQKQLTDVRASIGSAEETKAGAEARNADLESENSALTACVDAVERYLWDGLEGDARSAAFDTMFTACQ